GVAVRDTPLAAYERAFATDPTSAFGGIIAFNRPLDAATARAMLERQFVEVIVAPEVEPDAAEALGAKSNVRVLVTGAPDPGGRTALDLKKVSGGLLVQEIDAGRVAESDLRVVTKVAPDAGQMRDL